jgi:hypothetical protein
MKPGFKKPEFKKMVCDTIPTPIRPPAYQQFRGCTRKVAFKTQELAQKAINQLLSNNRDTNPAKPLLPYKCEHCLAWHFGHSRNPQ